MVERLVGQKKIISILVSKCIELYILPFETEMTDRVSNNISFAMNEYVIVKKCIDTVLVMAV